MHPWSLGLNPRPLYKAGYGDTWKVETRGSEDLEHPCLHSKCEDSLGYMRIRFKKTKMKIVHISSDQCCCCFPEPEGKSLLLKAPHGLRRRHRETEPEGPLSDQTLRVQDAMPAVVVESWSIVILSCGPWELYCQPDKQDVPTDAAVTSMFWK